MTRVSASRMKVLLEELGIIETESGMCETKRESNSKKKQKQRELPQLMVTETKDEASGEIEVVHCIIAPWFIFTIIINIKYVFIKL